MKEPLVFLHGHFIRASRAHLTLHDAGFVLGATVTDLCRTFRQRLFRWDDHLARFRESCSRAYLSIPLTDADLTARAAELIDHNARLLPPGGELALVLFATPGPIGFYLGEPGGAGDGPITFGMHTFPLPFARYRPLFLQGARLAIPTIRQVPAACVGPSIKQRSRLHWWLADQEVRQSHPGAQALLLNEDGFVTETASSNFLIVKDGTILTPPAPSVLPGISLKVLRELSKGLGVPWQEKCLTPEECRGADEAILTCTSYCAAGVARFHDQVLPWPGPALRGLLGAWSEQVGVDIEGQILG